MGRRLLALLFVAVFAACDDPLIIVGDLPGFMRVTAGVPDSAGIRLDSIATRTKLTGPAGVAADSTGLVYVGDLRSRIFRISSNGRIQRVLNHDGCATKACVGRPQGLAVAPAGNILYIADDMSDKIWRLNLGNGNLLAIAGNGVNALDMAITTGAIVPSVA